MAKPALQLQGKVFGYLTVLSRAPNTKDGKSAWNLRCVCGREIQRGASDFVRPRYRNQSCGCKRSESIGAANTKHGMSAHPAYAVWRSMIDRCKLPTHQAWHNYGARGIKVCARWTAFENFWADMGPTYKPGLTIDREDNDGDYTLKNCRWVTSQVQGNNRRGNRRIHTPWGRLTVAQASRESGICNVTLLYRLDHKVPAARLFDPPKLNNRFHESV